MYVEAAQPGRALRNTNLSDFILNSARKEAEQVIAAHQVISLGERDSIALAEALATPPAPSDRARQAARDYLDLYHG